MGKITKFDLGDLERKLMEEAYRVPMEIPKRPEGYKKEGYVYDENQTVKWNREHQKELADKYEADRKKFDEASAGKSIEMQEDFIKAINQEYGFNAKQAQILFSRAYDDEHDTGMLAVLYKVRDLAEMVKDIIEEEME